MFLNRFRKSKIIPLESVGRIEYPIFEAKTLNVLQKHYNPIYETPTAYWAQDEDGFLVRVRKENWLPTIRKVKSVALDPNDKMIQCSKKTLFEIASDLDSEVFETSEAWILLTHALTFMAKKVTK